MDKLVTVETAAIFSDHDGRAHSLPRPFRHCHIIWYLASEGFPIPISGEQGFLLSDGSFVRRGKAKLLAIIAGQIPKYHKAGTSDLFSEDLWETPDWLAKIDGPETLKPCLTETFIQQIDDYLRSGNAPPYF